MKTLIIISTLLFLITFTVSYSEESSGFFRFGAYGGEGIWGNVFYTIGTTNNGEEIKLFPEKGTSYSGSFALRLLWIFELEGSYLYKNSSMEPNFKTADAAFDTKIIGATFKLVSTRGLNSLKLGGGAGYYILHNLFQSSFVI